MRNHKALIQAARPTRSAAEIVGKIAAIVYAKEIEEAASKLRDKMIGDIISEPPEDSRYPDNQEDADLYNMDVGMDARRERD